MIMDKFNVWLFLILGFISIIEGTLEKDFNNIGIGLLDFCIAFGSLRIVILTNTVKTMEKLIELD